MVLRRQRLRYAALQCWLCVCQFGAAAGRIGRDALHLLAVLGVVPLVALSISQAHEFVTGALLYTAVLLRMCTPAITTGPPALRGVALGVYCASVGWILALALAAAGTMGWDWDAWAVFQHMHRHTPAWLRAPPVLGTACTLLDVACVSRAVWVHFTQFHTAHLSVPVSGTAPSMAAYAGHYGDALDNETPTVVSRGSVQFVWRSVLSVLCSAAMGIIGYILMETRPIDSLAPNPFFPLFQVCVYAAHVCVTNTLYVTQRGRV